MNCMRCTNPRWVLIGHSCGKDDRPVITVTVKMPEGPR